MAASVDGKTCSSPAEILFRVIGSCKTSSERSKVLRTFLHNQGMDPYAAGLSGESFFKARPPRAASASDDSVAKKGKRIFTPSTTCRASTAMPGGRPASLSSPVLAQPTLLPFHSVESRAHNATEKARGCREWGRVGAVPRRVPPPPQRQAPGSSARGQLFGTGSSWSSVHGRSPPGTAGSLAIEEDLFPAASCLIRRPSSVQPRVEVGKGARRRRPLYDFFSEDDPLFVDFSEEPDDPRVFLPAHRIGDNLPEVTESPKTKVRHSSPKASLGGAKRKASKQAPESKSMPSLRVSAKKLPLHAAPAPAPASTHGVFAGSTPDARLSSAGYLRDDDDPAGSNRWAESSPSRPVRRKPSTRRDIVWRASEDSDEDGEEDVEQVDVSSLPDSYVEADEEDLLPE